jgi:hypothetical protein
MNDQPKLTRAELAQFTGSDEWHRHGLVRSILFTDGAKYVAERAGAYGFSTRSLSRNASRNPLRPRNFSSGS